ncbi:MAG: hypothetical protein K0S29_323 [Gammaproteobacteria bacterium]|jgi:hypothetical protein|nr:hypothetical protein [Gammaproteobacteria bacterium]
MFNCTTVFSKKNQARLLGLVGGLAALGGLAAVALSLTPQIEGEDRVKDASIGAAAMVLGAVLYAKAMKDLCATDSSSANAAALPLTQDAAPV